MTIIYSRHTLIIASDSYPTIDAGKIAVAPAGTTHTFKRVVPTGMSAMVNKVSCLNVSGEEIGCDIVVNGQLSFTAYPAEDAFLEFEVKIY